MPRRGDDAETSGVGTTWIVLRHTQAEGLGLIANPLRDLGIQHRTLDLARGEPPPRDLRGVGGLIVLGGPMAIYESDAHPFLKREMDLVEKAITAGRPVLGICLGAQMIAHVLGGRVYRGDKPEIGWGPITLTEDGQDDPLLFGVDSPLEVFHLHGDTYELPADAKNLATSPAYEQQAFRWGDLVYGFQCHLEFTDAMITRIASEPDTAKLLSAAGVDVKALLAQTPDKVHAIGPVGERIFSRYFEQCGL
jgi:GMP synthase (glutamine-hydrolysing)